MTPQNEAELLKVLQHIASRLDDFVDTSQLYGIVMRLESTVGSHDARLVKTEESAIHTGNVYVEDLKKKLDEMQKSEQHWTRYVVGVIVSIAVVIISAVIGYAIRK